MIPDYGLRMKNEGYPQEAAIHFPAFKIYNISMISLNKFTTMVEMPYDGILHALSLDFGPEILKTILMKAEPNVREYIITELKKDALSENDFDLVEPIDANVTAHLGSLQLNDNEQYVPLIIDSIE